MSLAEDLLAVARRSDEHSVYVRTSREYISGQGVIDTWFAYCGYPGGTRHVGFDGTPEGLERAIAKLKAACEMG